MASRFDELNWKRIEDDLEGIEGGFDDGTFYGLEEIDDVDVVKEAGTVKLVAKSAYSAPKASIKTKAKPTKKAEKVKKTNSKVSVGEKNAKDETDSTNEFSALVGVEDGPAYSLGEWPSGLDWRIYTGLRNHKFLSPTEIQAQSIPLIMKGYDVIGKAATGSGKTLAYSIPLLNRYYKGIIGEVNNDGTEEGAAVEPQDTTSGNKVSDESEEADATEAEEAGTEASHNSSTVDSYLRRPEGLIISPTRELAHQIRDHLQAIIPKEDKNKVVALTGGLALPKQLRLLSKYPAVVVATPGRLLEILQQMTATQQSEWQRIPSLVLDEADRLIQSGSFTELESALKIIGISHKRQVLVFSATFSTELWGNLSSKNLKRKREDIRVLMEQKFGLNSTAHMVDADPESKVADSVRQALIECPNMEKDLYAYYFLLLYPGKSIMFVNSIDAVKRVTPLFKELGLKAFGVHSEMIQKQRLRSIERFKETENAVLVATDVAARGLDVPLVDHVLHYHLPRSGDMYVHRSGRTARAGNMGVSVTLCSPQEASGPLPNLLKLIETKPQQIDVDYDILEKVRDRVRLAKRIADTQSLATKKGKSDSWLNDAAQELGVDLDDNFGKLDGRKSGKREEGANTDALKSLRAELADMLSRKLGTNRRYLTSGTENLAHQLLKRRHSPLLGKPLRSALDELKPSKRFKKFAKSNAECSSTSPTKKTAVKKLTKGKPKK